MARNIAEIWHADRRALAVEARAEALQYSWDRSMETLFGTVYPGAFLRRGKATVVAPAVAPLAA